MERDSIALRIPSRGCQSTRESLSASVSKHDDKTWYKTSSLLLYRDKSRLDLDNWKGQVARILTCLLTKHLVDPHDCPF